MGKQQSKDQNSSQSDSTGYSFKKSSVFDIPKTTTAFEELPKFDQDSFLKNFGQGLDIGTTNLIAGAKKAVAESVMLADPGNDWAASLSYKADEYRKTAPEADGSVGQFIGQLVPSAVPSAAAVGATMLSGGIAAPVAMASIGTLGLSSAGSGMYEYEDYQKRNNLEVDKGDMFAIGLAYGAAEMLAERVGLNQLAGKGAKTLWKGNKEAAKKTGVIQLEEYFKKYPNKKADIAKKLVLAGNIEGLEELSTSVAQDMIANGAFRLDKDDASVSQIIKNAGASYLAGGLMGSAIGPISYASQNVANKKRRKANGFVQLAEDTSTGDVIELVQRIDGGYKGITPHGTWKDFTDDQIGQQHSIETEQFYNLLNDRGDFSKLQEEAARTEAAQVKAQRRKDYELVEKNFFTEGREGNPVLKQGLYQGSIPVMIVGQDPTTPNLVYITNPNEATKRAVDISEVSNITESLPEQVYEEMVGEPMQAAAEENISNQINEILPEQKTPPNTQPLQRGEQVSATLADGRVIKGVIAGLSDGVVNVEIEDATGEGLEVIPIPIDEIDQFRTPNELTEDTLNEGQREVFDESGEIIPMSQESLLDAQKNENVDQEYELKELPVATGRDKQPVSVKKFPDGTIEVDRTNMLQKEANDIASKLNERYPKANYQVEDHTPDDPMAESDWRVIHKSKNTESAENSKPLSIEKDGKTLYNKAGEEGLKPREVFDRSEQFKAENNVTDLSSMVPGDQFYNVNTGAEFELVLKSGGRAKAKTIGKGLQKVEDLNETSKSYLPLNKQTDGPRSGESTKDDSRGIEKTEAKENPIHSGKQVANNVQSNIQNQISDDLSTKGDDDGAVQKMADPAEKQKAINRDQEKNGQINQREEGDVRGEEERSEDGNSDKTGTSNPNRSESGLKESAKAIEGSRRGYEDESRSEGSISQELKAYIGGRLVNKTHQKSQDINDIQINEDGSVTLTLNTYPNTKVFKNIESAIESIDGKNKTWEIKTSESNRPQQPTRGEAQGVESNESQESSDNNADERADTTGSRKDNSKTASKTTKNSSDEDNLLEGNVEKSNSNKKNTRKSKPNNLEKSKTNTEFATFKDQGLSEKEAFEASDDNTKILVYQFNELEDQGHLSVAEQKIQNAGGVTVTTEDFDKYGDPNLRKGNKHNKTKRFLRKGSQPLDSRAAEIGVSEQDIIDYIVNPPARVNPQKTGLNNQYKLITGYNINYEKIRETVDQQESEVVAPFKRTLPNTPKKEDTRLADSSNEEMASQALSPFVPKKKDKVEAMAKEVTKGWKNAPKIEVFEGLLDFATNNPAYFNNWKQRAGGINKMMQIPAFFDGNNVILIANNSGNSTKSQITSNILHESIGHFGLRGFVSSLAQASGSDFQTEFNGLLDEVVNSFKNSSEFKSLQNTYRLSEDASQAEKREIAEELIAHRAEKGINDSIMSKVVEWFRKMYRQITGKYLKLNDAEIQNIIGNARRFVTAGDSVLPRSLVNPSIPAPQVMMAKRMDNSQELINFESNENSQNKSEQVSRGEFQETYQQPFQTAFNDIRANSSSTGTQQQRLDSENKAALQYAKDNDLWYDDFYSLGKSIPGAGVENTLAIDDLGEYILKSNNLMLNEGSVLKLINRTLAHNAVFPETGYELVGFTGIDNGTKAPTIQVILKQKYEKNARQATQEEIDEFMEKSGYKKDGEEFEKGDIIIGDLRPRNVLVSESGNIAVIDPFVDFNDQLKNLNDVQDNVRFKRNQGNLFESSNQGDAETKRDVLRGQLNTAQKRMRELQNLQKKNKSAARIPEMKAIEKEIIRLNEAITKTMRREDATRGGEQQTLFKRAPEEGTSAYEKWKGEATEYYGPDIQDIKSGEPVLVRVYHGTTNDFYVFDSSVKGNIEGHLGKVNYFTSDPMDAASNYQSDGQDLTNRIEQRKERLVYDLEELTIDEIEEQFNVDWDEVYPEGIPEDIDYEELANHVASKELKGGEDKVLDLWVKLNNPLVLGNKPTWVESIPLEEYEDYLDDAAVEIAEEYDVEVEEAKSDYEYEVRDRAIENANIWENRIVTAMQVAIQENTDENIDAGEVLGESGYESEIDLNQLEENLRKNEGLVYAEGEDGLASSQIIAQFFKNLGYDGIILTNVSERFKNMGLSDSMSHIHVFDEFNNQIKLASGENTTFDSNNPDIRFKRVGTNANLDQDVRDSLQVARKLEMNGQKPGAIRLATGWERGADRKWKYEIADGQYQDVENILDVMLSKEDKSLKFEELLNYPELLKAYPDAKDIQFNFITRDESAGIEGTFYRGGNKIELNRARFQEHFKDSGRDQIKRGTNDLRGLRRLIHHELTHWVQNKEGWANGGNPNVIGEKDYNRLMGEVEARDVAKRLDYTPNDRRNIPFINTEDVDRKDQILYRFNDEPRFKRNNPSDNFYSNSLNSLSAIPMEKATGDQWKAMLLKNGGSSAELEWMGFDDFLKGNKKPTKQEVMDFIAANQVEVVDVVKGKTGLTDEEREIMEQEIKYEALKIYADQHGLYHDDRGADGYNYLIDEDSNETVAEGFIDDIDNEVGLEYDFDELDNLESDEQTKYSDYQLPGGENYKELLLTMPNNSSAKEINGKIEFKEQADVDDFLITLVSNGHEEWNYWRGGDDNTVYFKGNVAQAKALLNYASGYTNGWRSNLRAQINSTEGESVYQSSHWDEPNILSHVRFNERYDQDDNKVLFIEEIQSDWAQEGRKVGFNVPLKNYTKDNTILHEKGEFIYLIDKETGQELADRMIDLMDKKERENIHQIMIDWKNKVQKLNDSVIADMPFKQTNQWINLSVKRMIRYAAENNFDKVAWVTGEQSAERYDLSKQVKSIKASKNSGGWTLKIIDNNNNPITQEANNESKLESLVGKELAQKIIEDTPNKFDEKKYTDVDLKVGGEGMKSFYDKILPSTVSKLLKKFDKTVKVEVTDFANYKEWYQSHKADSDPTWSELKKLSKEEQNEYYEAFREDLAANKRPSEQLSFEVTPALRQKSIQEGMPMFKRNPVVQEEPGKWTEFKRSLERKVLDQFADLKRLQDQKLSEGGLLEDEMNAYNKETLSKSKITVQQENFKKDLEQPLVDNIKEIFKTTGTKYDEVTNYLKAKHALERNAYMRDKTGSDDDTIFGGMSDKEAQAAIKAFEGKVPKKFVSKLHNQVKDINRFTLEKQLKDGLITKDAFDKVSGMYEFYVPLRGYASVSFDPTRFSGFKKAKGRTSEAGDPIAYMITMADTAIIHGEKNKVKQSMLEFVKANPDNKLWNIKNVWFVNSGQVDEDGKEIWYESIDRPSQEMFDQGMVKKSYDPDREVLRESQFTKENLTALVGGRKVSIEFIGDAVRIGQAFKSLHVDKAPKYMKGLNKYMAFLRSTYTQYSPEFIFRNLIRDMTAGYLNIQNDHGVDTANKVVSNAISAGKTIKRGLFGKGGTSKMDKYFQEYMDNGATTGYSDIKSISEHSERMKTQIEGLKSNKISWTKDQFKKVLGVIDDTNRVFENTMRFSAYSTLRDKGVSVDKAAVYAKELTVNFNKKGEWSDAIGALYLFFNASIQGSKRMMAPFSSTDKNVRRRAIATAVALPAMAMAMAMMNRIVGGEDDDGEYYYDKLPEHTRSHNLLFANIFSDKEGDFIQIPLPYGFNFFVSSGDNMLRALLGKDTIPHSLALIASSSLGSFSPLGSPDIADEDAEWFDHVLRFAPTPAQPIVDLALNRNFAGFPVYKEPWMQGETDTPDSKQYFSNVNPIIKGLTTGLNQLTGGDDVQPGMIDVNPETLEHFIGTLGGGVFTFANNMATSTAMVMDGKNPISFEEDRYKKVPFLRNYLTSPSIYDAQQTFFENVDQIEDDLTLHKRYIKLGDHKKANKYKEENKDSFRLQAYKDTISKRIENVNKRRKSLEKMKSTPGIELRIKELREMESKLYTDFNKRYNKEVELSASDYIQ